MPASQEWKPYRLRADAVVLMNRRMAISGVRAESYLFSNVWRMPVKMEIIFGELLKALQSTITVRVEALRYPAGWHNNRLFVRP
ncbi:hypothetical protein D3C75_438610 [compost metagenome]